MFQLREALIERADLRQRARSRRCRACELTEKIETSLGKQIVQAQADQWQFLIQGGSQTRLYVCQNILGVGERVPRDLDGVDNPQRNQVEDLFLGIEQQIG